MKRKSVFFLTGSLKVGGAEKVVTLIGDNLSKSGFDVYIVLLKNKIELPVSNELKILHLNTQNYKFRITKIVMAFMKLWFFYFKYKPHRITSFSSGLNFLLFVFMLPNQVYRIDTNLFFVKIKLYRRRFLKLAGYFPMVKNVVLPSHELRLKFSDYVSERVFRKFVTIHNPVQFDKSLTVNKFNIKQPYIISVARLNKFKGFEQLIRCFMKADFNSDLHLYILGSGPEKDKLDSLISELNAEERIHLLGFVKYPAEYIAGAEALVLNSSFEAFANVLLEGLSLGVPVLSNDCDFGPREIIIDGKNGLLFDNTRDENLIGVLEYYINSEGVKKNLKKNTTYGIDRFSKETITKEWSKILE